MLSERNLQVLVDIRKDLLCPTPNPEAGSPPQKEPVTATERTHPKQPSVRRRYAAPATQRAYQRGAWWAPRG